MLPFYRLCVIKTLDSTAFQLLLGFILFDIITGTALAFKNGVVNSRINKTGLTKHFIIVLLVLFFAIVFSVTGLREYFNILVSFYIASYGISITENLGLLGVPLPAWLKNKFIILRSESDEIKTADDDK